MSLADKVIKNTFYYVIFQLFGFLFPLILTPFIISKIGEVQFGIYALVLGFIGMFSLFDLSISSSFVVFISRYYVKKDFVNLNKYLNTGLFFYIFFSLIIVVTGFIFSKPLLSLLNIPPELFVTSVNVYNIGLIVFFISSAFTIFSSVLISLQKMYITSAIGVLTGLINLIATILVLNYGYGLTGIMWVQLAAAAVNNILSIIYAKKSLPEISIGFGHLEKNPVKEMSKFGAQMQISKLASFASEKYDEFLLAYFSVLNNVTYFNIANRISRIGRVIPFQVIYQAAPVSSELNAKGEKEKLAELFLDTTKYLILISAPVFVFTFIFSDLIITTWVGEGFELSSRVLRILVIGQLINMTFSAPGNSIIPNMGIPKYQMKEGLIYLGINLILSFLLIKHYGIIGAAIGSVLSTVIAASYLYYTSAKFFSKNKMELFSEKYLKPVLASILSGLIVAAVYYLSDKYIYKFSGKISGVIYLIILCVLFLLMYAVMILNVSYINSKDKVLIAKVLIKILPEKYFQKDPGIHNIENAKYSNEQVSIFIVTHNRLEMLKKCCNSILPTLKNINYELIIIDNASDDGTKDFLEEIKKSFDRIRIITNEKNIGINSKSLGAEAAGGDYIIGIDDDVIMFPDGWVEKMVRAFRVIPKLGYLALDVIQDETTNGAKHPAELYYKEYYDNGNVILEVGPTGGWCFMISRDVYNKTGKLITFENRIFYPEDGDYVSRITNSGLKHGILSGVKVYHATGDIHNEKFKEVYEEKYRDYSNEGPLLYRLKTALLKTFSLKRYIIKLKEYASRQNQ